MTNSTPIFDRYNHRRLWQWLSEHPDKHKWDWPKWEENGGNIQYVEHYCFACEYNINMGEYDCCKCCPFGDFSDDKGCLDGLYNKYDNEKDLVKKSELAERIRDLPIRKDMEVLTK